jgi:hypothetical protein
MRQLEKKRQEDKAKKLQKEIQDKQNQQNGSFLRREPTVDSQENL